MVGKLISRHGSTILIDGVEKKVYLDTHKETEAKTKRPIALPYFNMRSVLSISEIGHDSKLKIYGEDYLVFEIIDSPTIGGDVKYYDTIVFKDDFVNDIEIGKQSLSMEKCNLPKKENTPYKSVKAQIRTKKHNDILQYSLSGQKPPTHEFIIRYENDINIGDVVTWGDRAFEVLSTINIDEMNRFLIINTIEVLNV